MINGFSLLCFFSSWLYALFLFFPPYSFGKSAAISTALSLSAAEHALIPFCGLLIK